MSSIGTVLKTERFSFFSIFKILFTNKTLSVISAKAKVLYNLNKTAAKQIFVQMGEIAGKLLLSPRFYGTMSVKCESEFIKFFSE